RTRNLCGARGSSTRQIGFAGCSTNSAGLFLASYLPAFLAPTWESLVVARPIEVLGNRRRQVPVLSPRSPARRENGSQGGKQEGRKLVSQEEALDFRAI